MGGKGPGARPLGTDFLGLCSRREEMLHSLPGRGEEGAGDQVPLGGREGSPGRRGVSGHLEELHPQCWRLSAETQETRSCPAGSQGCPETFHLRN